MEHEFVTVQILYEDPFWIGLIERIEDRKLSVCKITFGAEPKDYQVYEYLQKNVYRLKFSPAVAAAVEEKKKNLKRMQREITKQMQENGICPKSWMALKLQQEQQKTERKQQSREQKLETQKRLFELKQQQKKEKHKGR